MLLGQTAVRREHPSLATTLGEGREGGSLAGVPRCGELWGKGASWYGRITLSA